MGWWSCDILGGDSPYDYQYMYRKKIGIDVDSKTYDEDPQENEKIQKFVSEQLESWKGVAFEEGTYDPVGVQVGILMAMMAGAEVTNAYKQWAIPFILKDEWSTRDEERKKYVDHLVDLVKQYDGTAIDYDSPGLFDVMAKKLEENSIDYKEKYRILRNEVASLLGMGDDSTDEEIITLLRKNIK